MRVRLSSFRGDQRGIASLMVAVSTLALFGAASIAVDLGHLWASRRHVIVASDASALAAASEYAVGRDGCAVAPGYVAANDGDATLQDCGPSLTSPTSGYVTVGASTPVDFAFANAIGFADRTVGATTTAAWGVPGSVAGLRPFGLCRDDVAFKAWRDHPVGISAPARVYYSSDPTNCGGAPGNWGIVDLDNHAPVANSDTKQWILSGYHGYVPTGDIDGDPGAYSNTLDDWLVQVQNKRFPIPVFDRVAGTGSTSTFHVVGFVAIQLLGWRTTGPEAERYLDVRFVEMVAAGTCCVPGPDFGLRAVHICEVDPNFDPNHCSS